MAKKRAVVDGKIAIALTEAKRKLKMKDTVIQIADNSEIYFKPKDGQLVIREVGNFIRSPKVKARHEAIRRAIKACPTGEDGKKEVSCIKGAFK